MIGSHTPPAGGPSAQPESEWIWVIDTSALVSAAISPDLDKQITAAMGNDQVMLLSEVVEELKYLAGSRNTIAVHGAQALKNLDLYGSPRFGNPIKGLAEVARADVQRIQNRISDPRVLRHDDEHLVSQSRSS